MHRVKPLPSWLVQRYHGWKATTFQENHAWYRRLADEGQRPRAMMISCCDSRLNMTQVFGADQGEFFIHRNIANLVPAYKPDGHQHGTSAAVEFAVNALKVSQIIVVGHARCGGVAGCHAMCRGEAPELEVKESFVGRWMDILKPGYDRVKGIEDEDARIKALEQQSVVVSLENLLTFPYVAGAEARQDLTLHGLWADMGEGNLEEYDRETGRFRAI